jgi:16S rRNA (cytosine967-C5)-methyltransferase
MTRPAPARRASYAALHAVNTGRSDLPDALARSRERLSDERDRALVAEIVSGTLRWMAALDAVIEACADRPLSRLDPEVLDVLRLSAYQILHLDRVPARASVDDAVELVRECGKASAAGFVNALLRRIDRDRDRLSLPGRPASGDAPSALDYLAVTLSHPRWLVERWRDRLGFEAAETWARFDNEPAPLTLRTNTLRISRDELVARLAEEGVEAVPARFAPDGLSVRAGNPLDGPAAAAWLFFVQDEASQLVALAADAQPGERVLDACASPGGKTVAMASQMNDRGMLVAGDLRARRIELLHQTVTRSGAACVRLVRADVAAVLPFGPVFDRVLLDAPCSGLGTIRRDPEIRWRRSLADLRTFARRQALMLEHAAAVVRPGGRVVYATCSSEPEENDAVVAAFLNEHPGFALEPAGAESPHDSALTAVRTREGFLRTRPDEHRLEAFFAAVLRRC